MIPAQSRIAGILPRPGTSIRLPVLQIRGRVPAAELFRWRGSLTLRDDGHAECWHHDYPPAGETSLGAGTQ